ncbi:gentisate 1,2-dioxygenase [Minwuia thermotolerans]|uniref:Gentisate 1,2-dioxygenase n=1 Tax=Minwuia thermotolerans TaxID=2056226 RepID=A0A2M9G5D7_9PROT|nr:gentisate 1,2-dioxygenase [Minwuia thermotolerans]PJK30921.1 gentisate 1,2-dioxygenase [Minwuia thermotolerans]
MPSEIEERRKYYAAIGKKNLAPLWEVLHGLVTPEPVHRVQPAIWRYDDIRDDIMASGELITAKEAERRVLILENPGMPGESKITTSLYAGLQLILPGEVAPAHRHTQSALRFVVEGAGAYTAVDGERTTMHPGDFVITPNWTWHDHGNDSDEPMVWLDGLDIPVVGFFGASFAEKWGEDRQPISRPEGDSLARYGQGLLPDGYARRSHTSPVFSYPYDRTREALETMRRREEWDAAQGLKLSYVNPVNGDFAIPTMGTFMQLLPAGFAGVPYRATDATVFSVVEGRGTVEIGEQRFDFGPRDHFVAPSWSWYRFEAAEDCVIFSFSDRPIQQKLDLWREQRGNA